MKLFLVGHSYRYAIEQAIVAFLNRKAVLCGDADKSEDTGTGPLFSMTGADTGASLLSRSNRPEDTEDRLISTLSYGRKYITATAELVLGGRKYKKTERMPIEGTDSDEERISREQHILKTSLFKVARQATGAGFPWGSLTGVRPTKLVLGMLESGYTRDSAKKELIDRYYLSPERAKLAVEAASHGLEVKRSLGDRDVSLYVGIPFCPSRCAYCSFVSSEIGKSFRLVEPYLEMLSEEIRQRGRLTKELGLKISSVYIGGGTPTSLSAAQLDKLMYEVAGAFDLAGLREYTVEAGRPDTITEEKLRVIRSNGAGRISINPQSMSKEVLDRNRRPHSPEDVLRAFEQARGCGFECINMDTIAGLPGDSTEGFKSTLFRLAELRPENITVHTLALKRGSDLAARAPFEKQDSDVMAMLDFATDFMYNNGYRPYYLYRQKYMAASLENTGWTLPGWASIYNICIMEEFQTIISVGAGGVTKLVSRDGKKIIRVANNKFPAEYIKSGQKIDSDNRKICSFYR